MSNFKEKIGGIIIVLICVFFCGKCTNDYLKGGDKNAMANYEKMLADKSVTEAVLSDEYKQTTVKIMKIPITTYEFSYTFNVDGKLYNGKKSFETTLPTTNKIQVHYLKSDPSINCVDPAKLLAQEKEKSASNSDLYWGIGWGIVGLFLSLGVFSKDEKKDEVATPSV